MALKSPNQLSSSNTLEGFAQLKLINDVDELSKVSSSKMSPPVLFKGWLQPVRKDKKKTKDLSDFGVI